MENDHGLQKSRLETLPIELRQLILAALPDVTSLRSAALSCWSMYRAFTSAERLITTPVLTTQLNPDILRIAILTDEVARHDTPWAPEEAQTFLVNQLSNINSISVSRSWNLSEALRIGQHHDHIRYFTHDFASYALAPWGDKPSSLSQREINRIETALYRLEIYRLVFRCKDKCADEGRCFEDQKEFFHNMFPVWENEQLACMHDYLMEKLKRVFRSSLAFIPEWSGYLDIVGEGIPHACLQYHISQGLAHVRMILDNPLLVRSPEFEKQRFKSHYYFLEDPLSEALQRQYYDGTMYDIEEIVEQFPQSSDPDSGPVEAWEWARATDGYELFVCCEHPIPVRTWGYVLWDHARLDDWGVFGTVWERCDADAVMEADKRQVTMDKKLIEAILKQYQREEARIRRQKEKELKWP